MEAPGLEDVQNSGSGRGRRKVVIQFTDVLWRYPRSQTFACSWWGDMRIMNL